MARQSATTRKRMPIAAKNEFREEVGPTEVYDPVVRNELKRAVVWLGLALLIGLVILLIQPILLIIGGLVLAAMLDGGARLLGRILPIARGFRLAIVVLALIAFAYWTATMAGTQLAEQAVALQQIVQTQTEKLLEQARVAGFAISGEDFKNLSSQVLNSVGRVTAAVGSALGIITNLAMMLVLAIFIAADPRLYERGVAWMVPMADRDYFYGTMEKIGSTVRRLMAGRLLGMFVEGIGTWLLLTAAGVPMAALLGLLTGILAFLPNIGAIISGVLLTLVGFSAGFETGIYALMIYFVVQTVDGYLIVPMVAKRAVDLAPALVLGAQILFGALFGIIGLALADPIIAMIKVALERQSERNHARHAKADPA